MYGGCSELSCAGCAGNSLLPALLEKCIGNSFRNQELAHCAETEEKALRRVEGRAAASRGSCREIRNHQLNHLNSYLDYTSTCIFLPSTFQAKPIRAQVSVNEIRRLQVFELFPGFAFYQGNSVGGDFI